MQRVPFFRAQLCTYVRSSRHKFKKEQPPKVGPSSADEPKLRHELRRKLVLPTIHALPYAGGHYRLSTSTCKSQLEYIFLKRQLDGTAKPVGYCSRSFIKAEQAYIPAQHEFFAIVLFVLILRPYLEGTRFTIRIDHD